MISQISTGNGSATMGRGRTEMASPFNFSILLVCRLRDLLKFFAYLFPFKSDSTFSFWLETAAGS